MEVGTRKEEGVLMQRLENKKGRNLLEVGEENRKKSGVKKKVSGQ